MCNPDRRVRSLWAVTVVDWQNLRSWSSRSEIASSHGRGSLHEDSVDYSIPPGNMSFVSKFAVHPLVVEQRLMRRVKLGP